MQLDNNSFKIGGLHPLTMIDYPGKIASVIFSWGCNLRCRYCHNVSLLDSSVRQDLTIDDIKSYLVKRRGFIEAVVFSGGEPCIHPGLMDMLRFTSELGYAVGLHSNGFFPEVIYNALNEKLLQFVAIDFKAPFAKYKQITGQEANVPQYAALANFLSGCGIDVEYRTTVHPDLLSVDDLICMAKWIAHNGAPQYVLQQFKHENSLDKSLRPVNHEIFARAVWLHLKSILPSIITRGDCFPSLPDLVCNKNIYYRAGHSNPQPYIRS